MREILLLIIMFWNVENYFDTFNNPNREDGEYTISGAKRWSYKKFIKKRDDISKTILSVKDREGKYPAIIGLCEVENRFVLNELIYKTPLSKIGYRIIHRDSPDRRGIDVALLYNPRDYLPLENRYIYPKENIKSREVLLSKGLINNGLDTIYIFVNHWPSKIGGEEGRRRRLLVQDRVIEVIDSIYFINNNANILLMGDFNDSHNNINLGRNLILGSTHLSKQLRGDVRGSYKYKGEWEIIDHFIYSKNLDRVWNGDLRAFYRDKQWLYIKPNSMQIYWYPPLLTIDKEYFGVKINRTYNGIRYNGGVSDHLPILLPIYKLEVKDI